MEKAEASGFRKALAGVSAAAVAALIALGGGAVASAEEGSTTPPAGPANIDFTKDGSITVHKHSNRAATGEAATGDVIDLGTNADPLEGVGFKVYKADFDLTDPAVWDGLEATLQETPTVPEGQAPVGDDATDADGQAVFSGLKPGVYIVEEQAATEGSNISKIAEPFYVVLPLVLPNSNDWTYDVHVYPKNEVKTEFKKELDKASVANSHKAGDPVKWKVSYTTPTVAAAQGHKLQSLVVTDTLDARLKAVEPHVQDVMYADAALEDADYTVAYDEAAGTVTVTLTDAGLAKVSANSGRDLTFTVLTTPKDDVATGNGELVNKADVTSKVVDGEDKPVKEDTGESQDTVFYGDARLSKVDAGNKAALSGAEFTLYASEEDANNGENAIGTYTSDENGVIDIKMIRVADDGAERDYWVKETKAPAGYVLDETVQKLTFTKGEVAEGTVHATVENVKRDNPIKLPLTGATGAMLFTALGAGLLGFGAVMMSRSRKNRVNS